MSLQHFFVAYTSTQNGDWERGIQPEKKLGTDFAKEPEFAWSSKERGVVLSAYFYGYITTQIVGAYIAPLVGAGRLYGMSILFTGILALLTPMAARTGIVALVAVRASQGALQVTSGPLVPFA